MPNYLFKHKQTGEIKEIFQKMNDKHYIGEEWERVFVNPQVSIDVKLDPHDSKGFVNKTRSKNYSLGQLWDESQNLSNKRGGMTGQDEVRQKAEDSYKRLTGKEHPHSKKREKKPKISLTLE